MSGLGNRELFRTCARLGLRGGGGDEDAVAQATRMTLSMLAERIEQLTGQIDELNRRLTRLVERHAPQLLVPVGIGPDSAVTLLIAMGDNPERLSTESSFAALCGVGPIGYSSGNHPQQQWQAEQRDHADHGRAGYRSPPDVAAAPTAGDGVRSWHGRVRRRCLFGLAWCRR